MDALTFQNLFSLAGRTALVTGASGDIGRTLAAGLAAGGATVALAGRSETKLAAVQQTITSAGGTAFTIAADLSDLSALPELVEAATTGLGHIDILLNCAGTNQRDPILDVTPEVYERIMTTNLHSAYFLSKAVVPQMIAAGGGKIINIGSLTSSLGLQNVSVYGMSKSALSQLTKTMAIEWAEHNIQVNCLCPGFIATELTATHWRDPQRTQWILGRTPAKRPGTPDDLVGMLIYLASHASDYTTGQSIYVDGGFTIGSQW